MVPLPAWFVALRVRLRFWFQLWLQLVVPSGGWVKHWNQILHKNNKTIYKWKCEFIHKDPFFFFCCFCPKKTSKTLSVFWTDQSPTNPPLTIREIFCISLNMWYWKVALEIHPMKLRLQFGRILHFFNVCQTEEQLQGVMSFTVLTWTLLN